MWLIRNYHSGTIVLECDTEQDALEQLAWLEEQRPGTYEIIFRR